MYYENKMTFCIPDGVLAFLVWICALTLQIPTYILMNAQWLSNLQNYLIIITFSLVFGLWLIQKRVSVNINKLLFLGYVLIVIIGTIFSNGSFVKATYEIMRMSVYFFLVGIAKRNNSEVFWKHLYASAILLLVCNFFVWLFNFNGLMYGDAIVYFFDTTNETPNYVIPLLAIVLIELFRRDSIFLERILVGSIALGNILMLLCINCSTGKVAIAMFIFMVLFSKMIARLISPRSLYLIFVGLLFLLVIVGVVHWFSFLIVDILGESLTLHTRTLAWEYAKEAFLLNPVFGRGYLSVDVKYSILCDYTNGRFSHSHCEFLELLLRSGIIGVACLNTYLIRVLSRATKVYRNSKIMQIVIMTIFVFLIMSINETCFTVYFYLLVAIAEGFELLCSNGDYRNKWIEVR